MDEHQKKLQYQAWIHCTKQADFIYNKCMGDKEKENNTFHCTLKKHQDHVFCMHHEKDKINEKLKGLAIHIADVGATGNSSTNPSVRSDFGN